MQEKKISIEELAVFCKRKGFVYPTAEIYGGFAGFFDYGHLGVGLKENIKREFWRQFVNMRDDMVGIDGSIITNPLVWNASGHADCFTDMLLSCKKCKNSVRADLFIEEKLNISLSGYGKGDIEKIIADKKLRCQKCDGNFSISDFNLMLKTNVGPIEAQSAVSYLRPETAQLIFINYKQVQESTRKKLPFGIAQIGKAFRNEISPRDFLFRSREFEQMEIEFFVHPKRLNECEYFDDISALEINLLTAELQKNKREHIKSTINLLVDNGLASKWHAYWLAMFYKWFLSLGIEKKNIRIREHRKDELAHYAGACFDIEYYFPIGWKEVHGNADRKQFDLSQHIKFSRKDLSYFDEDSKERIVPYVASEPSQGVDRAFLAFLYSAYSYDKKRDNVVLSLHPRLAPIKLGIFPLLSNKPELVNKAREIYNDIKKEYTCIFDLAGSIGRRYARMDEIGTPFCITIDFDTLKDERVTIRERDTTNQERVSISELSSKLNRMIYKNE